MLTNCFFCPLPSHSPSPFFHFPLYYTTSWKRTNWKAKLDLINIFPSFKENVYYILLQLHSDEYKKKKRNFKKYGNIVQFNRALRMLLKYPYTVHAVQNYYKEIRRRRRSEHTHWWKIWLLCTKKPRHILPYND